MSNPVYLSLEKAYKFNGITFSDKHVYKIRLFDHFDLFEAEIENEEMFLSILDVKSKTAMCENLLNFIYDIAERHDNWYVFEKIINYCLEYYKPMIFGDGCIDDEIISNVFSNKPRLKGE